MVLPGNTFSFISTVPLSSRPRDPSISISRNNLEYVPAPVCLRRSVYLRPWNRTESTQPPKPEKPQISSHDSNGKAQQLVSVTSSGQTKKTVSSSKTSNPKDDKPLRLRRSGMNSVMVLSDELQELTGFDMMRRGQVVTAIVQYLKQNNLQLEKNRFVCDEKLSRILGVKGEHSILKIQKYVGPQLLRPDDMGEEYSRRAKQLYEQYLQEKGAVDSRATLPERDPRGLNSAKRQQELKKLGKGMFKEVAIDPSLKPICGGKEKMARSQVVKAVWDYIKRHELQDSVNRRVIHVNDELRQALQMGNIKTIDCFQLGGFALRLCGGSKSNGVSKP